MGRERKATPLSETAAGGGIQTTDLQILQASLPNSWTSETSGRARCHTPPLSQWLRNKADTFVEAQQSNLESPDKASPLDWRRSELVYVCLHVLGWFLRASSARRGQKWHVPSKTGIPRFDGWEQSGEYLWQKGSNVMRDAWALHASLLTHTGSTGSQITADWASSQKYGLK